MPRNKEESNNKRFGKFLRKFLLKLRTCAMHKVGCCGIRFNKLKDHSRDRILLEELYYYIYYYENGIWINEMQE